VIAGILPELPRASRMSQQLYNLLSGEWPLVAESREHDLVKPEGMDELWAVGWRHFGTDFFRASLMSDGMCLNRQIALRIEVAQFMRSRSQRRTFRKNRDLELSFDGAAPGEAENRLFDIHKMRFAGNVPDCLTDFLGTQPDGRPCECLQLSVRLEGRLIAASFFALGRQACSSIYAVFDPEFSRRRLGVFTMLAELEFAREQGFRFYYSGYATVESSCYDYKKEFGALHYYDWKGRWLPVGELRA